MPDTYTSLPAGNRSILADRPEISLFDESHLCKSCRLVWSGLPLLSAACVLVLAMCGCGSGGSAPTPGALSLNPGTLQFGEVPVGGNANTSVEISNRGSETVVLSQIKIPGQPFSVVSGGGLPISIPGGGTHTLSVGFTPLSAGNYSGALALIDVSASIVAQAAIYGRGSAGVAQLSVSAASLSFGDITVNGAARETLTLKSIGTQPVMVSSAATSVASFSLDGASFPVTLNPSQSMNLTVQFQPAAVGIASGQLSIRSNSSTGATTVVRLSGTGIAAANPQLSVSTGSLSFGSVTVGTSVPQPLTLRSTGTSPVTVNLVAISGSGFTIAGGSFPVTLNPGQSVTLVVQFEPTTASVAGGQLSIRSNSSTGATTVVALSGTGRAADPELTTSAASVNFGSVPLNTATTSNLTLNSTGTTSVTVSSAQVQGAGFSIVGGSFPATLNPGQALSVLIRFQPTVAGAATGQLTITSDSLGGGSEVVPLSGLATAIAHEVDLSWLPPASSPDPVVGYNIYRSASGGQFVRLNSIVSFSTIYVDSTVVSSVSYDYVAKSVDANGVESVASNEYQVTIP